MLRYLLILAAFSFASTAWSQELNIKELTDIFIMTTKDAIAKMKNKNWNLNKEFKREDDKYLLVEHPIAEENDTITLILKKSFGRKSLIYITKRQERFDSLFTSAKNSGFKTLFIQEYRTGRHLALHKDSTTVIYFMKNGDTTLKKVSYEIAISEFKSWLTAFMPQNSKKRWSETDRYAFMLKCVGKKEPELLRDMITFCSCGGAILEPNNTFSNIIVLNKEQLFRIINQCSKYLKFDPY